MTVMDHKCKFFFSFFLLCVNCHSLYVTVTRPTKYSCMQFVHRQRTIWPRGANGSCGTADFLLFKPSLQGCVSRRDSFLISTLLLLRSQNLKSFHKVLYTIATSSFVTMLFFCMSDSLHVVQRSFQEVHKVKIMLGQESLKSKIKQWILI